MTPIITKSPTEDLVHPDGRTRAQIEGQILRMQDALTAYVERMVERDRESGDVDAYLGFDGQENLHTRVRIIRALQQDLLACRQPGTEGTAHERVMYALAAAENALMALATECNGGLSERQCTFAAGQVYAIRTMLPTSSEVKA